MDNQDFNTVDAVQENVVDSQDTTVNESVNAESEEVATPQTDSKPVQTPEQNAEFAKVRRETEARYKEKQDKFAQRYGYSSFEEMEQAENERQAEEEKQKFQQEHGINPDDLKPVFEQWKQNDPDFKELSSIRAEKNIQTALTDLNNELKDAGVDLQLKDLSDSEVNKIPNVDKVTQYVQKGHSLADAFFLANKKDIIAKQTQAVEQETIKKMVANGQSSPGSLSATSDTKPIGVWNMSKDDFKTMQDKALRGEFKRT